MEQMATENAKILAALGGTAEQVSRELNEFAQSARALSDDHPRFIDQFPEKWVAVYQGNVAATGDSLAQANQDAQNRGLPAQHLILRHITREEKTYFF